GDCINLVATYTGLQGRRAGLNRLDDCSEGALDLRWRAMLARPAHIPHTLEIGAVACVLYTQIDMHQVTRLDQDIMARGGVAGFGSRAAVHNRATIPAPGARQTARAELIVNKAADLGLADAGAD